MNRKDSSYYKVRYGKFLLARIIVSYIRFVAKVQMHVIDPRVVGTLELVKLFLTILQLAINRYTTSIRRP